MQQLLVRNYEVLFVLAILAPSPKLLPLYIWLLMYADLIKRDRPCLQLLYKVDATHTSPCTPTKKAHEYARSLAGEQVHIYMSWHQTIRLARNLT